MDVICRAMEKKLHISGERKLDEQTWKKFAEKSIGKKIFLFGIGASADFFFKTYGDIKLEGIIDNDVRKQGYSVEDFLWHARKTVYANTKISSIDLLSQYSPDEIMVLITSINYYKQIIVQLKEIGIENSYVFLIMEANKIEQSGHSDIVDDIEEPKDFASFCCQEPIEWNKIVFFSFGTYSDHGKYITEALLKVRNDLDIVWLVNDMMSEVPQGVRKVYLSNWKRYIYEMETARIWVYNMPVPEYVVKRSGQIYIQTKHWASITLKRFYLDSSTISSVEGNTAYWKQDSRKIDYIITGSDFDTQSSRRGFDFHKEVLQIGSPRSDAMFQEKEKKEKVYSSYGINSKKRIALYAPTYRYVKKRSVQEKLKPEIREIDLNYEEVKNALEKHFGGEWCIALRLHPGHEKAAEKLKTPRYVINMSAHEDGEELAAACDIMISDYSSIMFEPAFAKKPVFLFATDRKEYIDKEYDLLIDYDTLPFPIAESNEELIQNIEGFTGADYEKNLDEFMNQFGIHEDGHASDRAAKMLSDIVGKGGNKDGKNYTEQKNEYSL